MHSRYWTAAAAVVIGVSVVSGSHLTAQQAPAKRSVTVVRVKPEAVQAWQDFQEKQTVPGLKKAGVTERDVYQSIYGAAGEFRIVQPLAKYADRDSPQSPLERALGAGPFKVYQETLVKMLISSTTTIIEGIPDASTDPTPNAVFPVVILTRYHVAPGKAPEFTAWLRGERATAIKKGQPKRETISRVQFGGDNNEFRIASYESNIAALDGPSPLTRALGADGVAKLTAKYAGLVLSTDRTLWRRVEAMSIRPRPAS